LDRVFRVAIGVYVYWHEASPKGRHGCSLKQEGAQRAASNSVFNSLSDSDSPDMARGDQRSSSKRSTGYFGWR